MEAMILILLGIAICAVDIWAGLVIRLVRRIGTGGEESE